jgi:hypothetical protein
LSVSRVAERSIVLRGAAFILAGETFWGGHCVSVSLAEEGHIFFGGGCLNMREEYDNDRQKNVFSNAAGVARPVYLNNQFFNNRRTPKQEERMKAYSLALGSVPLDVDSYSLLQWQSPVKDQNYRGSCQTFSFLGAIEARYRREYGLQIELSAEYFINRVFSAQPTHDPFLLHENICTDYLIGAENPNAPSSGWMGGAQLMAAEKFTLPETKFCPYFGRERIGDPPVYGTGHTDDDLLNIAVQAGLVRMNPPGSQTPWSPVVPYTQRAVDNYYYDVRHIPLEARKNACYGAEEIEYVIPDDPAVLEACIFGNCEVVIDMGLGKLDWGDGTVYSGGQPVQTLDNIPIAIYPDQNLVDQTDPNTNAVIGKCGVNEKYIWINGAWQLTEDKHSMLAVAFDKTRRLILFKNSHGRNAPYMWIPYNFILEKCFGGMIITIIRNPLLNTISLNEQYPSRLPIEEAMWLGLWKMNHDGWPGELVIRHTRERGKGPGTVARLGTYYDSNGVARMVTGYIEFVRSEKYSGWSEYDFFTSKAHLWIDFDNPEGPPYPLDRKVDCQGQKFELQMYGMLTGLRGDHAVGSTVWNGRRYGVLLSRPGKEPQCQPGVFDVKKWLGEFLVISCDPPIASPQRIMISGLETLKNGYYSVNVASAFSAYNTVIIKPGTTHALELNGPVLCGRLYYHTRETGLATGDAIAVRTFYIGHKTTRELHAPDCEFGRMILDENRIHFLHMEDAFQEGFNGCYYCLRKYDAG